MLQESGKDSSLSDRINNSLKSLSDSLRAIGVILHFSATPVFDSKTFVASVDVSLSVALELSGSDILDIFDRFLENAIDAGNLEALGLSASNDPSPVTSTSMTHLLNSTLVSAGFDIDFEIRFNVSKLKNSATSNFGEAILESFEIEISTWGANALLIVDPIDLVLPLSSDSALKVRQSSFSLAANVKSTESFLVGSDDISGLTPTITVPLKAELTFDLEIADTTLSPMLSLSVDNIIDGLDLTDFTADLDLEPFLDGGAFGSGDMSLEAIFDDMTSLLNEITNYSPMLQLSDAPAAINGLFDVIDQASAFAEALTEFLSLVDDVQALVPPELRSFLRQINQVSSHNAGCINPSSDFTRYSFDLLQGQSLLPASMDIASFFPCDHLGEIQKALSYSKTLQKNVDLKSLVIIDSSLNERIKTIFGVELDIEELLDIFEKKSLLRLISFLSSFLASDQGTDSSTSTSISNNISGRRRMESTSSVSLRQSPTKHRRRLDLIRDVRGPRRLQRRAIGASLLPRSGNQHRNLGETTIASFLVGDYLEISANFNFNDKDKQVTLTARFTFDTDDR